MDQLGVLGPTNPDMGGEKRKSRFDQWSYKHAYINIHINHFVVAAVIVINRSLKYIFILFL